MSVMGGLVGTGHEHLAARRLDAAGDWAMRNAWGMILLGSLMFWAALAGMLIFG
jgi:hypothetical protein